MRQATAIVRHHRSARTISPSVRSDHFAVYCRLNATLGRRPTRTSSSSSDTSRSRNPSRTPHRRLALSGPHSSQASSRPRACARGTLPDIQLNAMDPHRQFRPFEIADRMHRRQRCSQRANVDCLLRPSSLKSGLRLRHAILYRFYRVRPGERTPRLRPMRFDDRVRVHENRGPTRWRALHSSIACSTPCASNNSSKPSIGSPINAAARRTERWPPSIAAASTSANAFGTAPAACPST